MTLGLVNVHLAATLLLHNSTSLFLYPFSSALLDGMGGDSCGKGGVQGLGHRGGAEDGGIVSQWNRRGGRMEGEV